ncbi:MAG TPA: Hsp20/alpha crystallin family protein [Chitinophagaceae bacterium]
MTSNTVESSTRTAPGRFPQRPLFARGLFPEDDEMITAMPPAHITNLPGTIRVELLAPGLTREDFFLCCRPDELTIYIMQRRGNGKRPELNYQVRIPLPCQADVEFVSAEYREETLRVHLPKAKRVDVQLPAENHQITIY